MYETLGMIYPVAKFLSPCEPVKLEKQVILPQSTIVVQAFDHSDRYSHLKRGKMKSKWESLTPKIILI